MGNTQQITDSVMATKEYIKTLSKFINKIKKAKPEDRMDYAFEVAQCLNALLLSVKGWEEWTHNLTKLHALSMEDYKEVYPKMRKSTIDFLKVDIEITKKKLIQVNKMLKELGEAKEVNKKIKKKAYVS